MKTKLFQDLIPISSLRNKNAETRNKDSKCKFRWRSHVEDLWLPIKAFTSPPPQLQFNLEVWELPKSARRQNCLLLCPNNQALSDPLMSVKLKWNSPSPRKLTKKIRGTLDQGKITDPCKNFATSAKSKSKGECKLDREPLKSLMRACLKWATQLLGCTEPLSTWIRAKSPLMASASNHLKIECWKKYCGRWLSKENRLSKLTRSSSRARKKAPQELTKLSISNFSDLLTRIEVRKSALTTPDTRKMRMIILLSNWEMAKSCSLKPKFKKWAWTQKLT